MWYWLSSNCPLAPSPSPSKIHWSLPAVGIGAAVGLVLGLINVYVRALKKRERDQLLQLEAREHQTHNQTLQEVELRVASERPGGA